GDDGCALAREKQGLLHRVQTAAPGALLLVKLTECGAKRRWRNGGQRASIGALGDERERRGAGIEVAANAIGDGAEQLRQRAAIQEVENHKARLLEQSVVHFRVMHDVVELLVHRVLTLT